MTDRPATAVVGHLDWSFADDPPPASATSSGLVRQRFIGWPEGAVHTDLSAIVLHPGGWLAPHVHSYEEALYILEGDLLLLLGERVHRVTAGDYTLMPTGMRHGLANTGSKPARFLSLNSPQKQDPDSGRADTYFEPAEDVAAWEAIAERPTFGDPTLRYVGHY
jgi:quercetin dioxygenase-like cupin family protein